QPGHAPFCSHGLEHGARVLDGRGEIPVRRGLGERVDGGLGEQPIPAGSEEEEYCRRNCAQR
ncbi:MAG: hypothetical protein JJE01_08575, partial [Gemmatimonadetes bacterium]|nr:hypothetical protein [Gemmatimonadota bacterium]